MRFNWVDSLYQLIVIAFTLVIPVVIAIIVINLLRRYEKRANERLLIEREKHSYYKEQLQGLQEMKDRVEKIELILKQVQ